MSTDTVPDWIFEKGKLNDKGIDHVETRSRSRIYMDLLTDYIDEIPTNSVKGFTSAAGGNNRHPYMVASNYPLLAYLTSDLKKHAIHDAQLESDVQQFVDSEIEQFKLGKERGSNFIRRSHEIISKIIVEAIIEEDKQNYNE